MPRLKFMSWTMTLAEAVAFATTVLAVTMWITATFVDKSSAREYYDATERRIQRIDTQYERLESKIDKIEDDVAVVRGILEVRNRKKHSD